LGKNTISGARWRQRAKKTISSLLSMETDTCGLIGKGVKKRNREFKRKMMGAATNKASTAKIQKED